MSALTARLRSILADSTHADCLLSRSPKYFGMSTNCYTATSCESIANTCWMHFFNTP